MKWCLPYNQWNDFNNTIVIVGIFVIQTQKVILKKQLYGNTCFWKPIVLNILYLNWYTKSDKYDLKKNGFYIVLQCQGLLIQS